MKSNSIDVEQVIIEDEAMFDVMIQSFGGKDIFKTIFGDIAFKDILKSSFVMLKSSFHNKICCFISVSDIVSLYYPVDTEKAYADIQKSEFNANISNSLFLNILLTIDVLTDIHEVLFQSLHRVFEIFPNVDYIFWYCPKEFRLKPYLSSLLEDILLNDESMSRIFKLLVFKRQQFLPKLSIRHAKIEDFDDILPLVKSSALYRDILISDEYKLIDYFESNDSLRRQFLVGLSNDEVVGTAMTTAIADEKLYLSYNFDKFPSLLQKMDVIKPEKPITIKQNAFIVIIGKLDTKISIGVDILQDLAYETNLLAIDMKSIIKSPILEAYDAIEKLIQFSIDDGIDLAGVVLLFEPLSKQDVDTFLNLDLNIRCWIELLNSELNQNKDNDLDFVELLHQHCKSTSNELSTWKTLHISDDFDELKKDMIIELENIRKVSVAITEDLLKCSTVQNLSNHLDSVVDKINAFELSLFDFKIGFESRSIDILQAAFLEYPEYDYCLLTLPFDKYNQLYTCSNEFASQLLSAMILVDKKPDASSNGILLVAHRQSLNYFFQPNQRLIIKRFDTADKSSCITFLRSRNLDYDEQAFNPLSVIIFWGESIVGLVEIVDYVSDHWNFELKMLQNTFDINELYDHKSLLSSDQMMLKDIIFDISLSCPIWSRHVIREVLRLHRKKFCFYQNRSSNSSLLSIKQVFTPIIPLQPMNNITTIEGLSSNVIFPLYAISMSGLTRFRKMIPSRIVIIGYNTITISFLQQILFRSDLYLPNCIVIQQLGVATKGVSLSPIEIESFSSDEISATGLVDKVSFIHGTLKEINRKNKSISLFDNQVIPYDMLFMSPEIQDNSARYFPFVSDLLPSQQSEHGIFSLGSSLQNHLAVKWIQNFVPFNENRVIIFGSGLLLWHVVGQTLRLGVNSSQIQVITTDSKCDLENKQLTKVLTNVLQDSHISVLYETEVKDVLLSTKGYICQVSIGSAHNMKAPGNPNDYIDLSCSTLFNCNMEQTLDPRIYQAITRAGLVYENGVIVDESFRTIDPYIFFASPISRFSKVFHNCIKHQNINYRELGQYVAKQFIQFHLLSHHKYESDVFTAANSSSPLPEFHIPKASIFYIPGGLNLFKTCRPTIVLSSTSRALVTPTGKIDSSLNTATLSVLFLDSYGEIIKFIHLSKDISQLSSKLAMIPYYHESHCRGALVLFSNGLISNWISFFSEDWAKLLFHRQFPLFIRNLRKQLLNLEDVQGLLNQLTDRLDSIDEDGLPELRDKLIGIKGDKLSDSTVSLIERYFKEFYLKEYQFDE